MFEFLGVGGGQNKQTLSLLPPPQEKTLASILFPEVSFTVILSTGVLSVHHHYHRKKITTIECKSGNKSNRGLSMAEENLVLKTHIVRQKNYDCIIAKIISETCLNPIWLRLYDFET